MGTRRGRGYAVSDSCHVINTGMYFHTNIQQKELLSDRLDSKQKITIAINIIYPFATSIIAALINLVLIDTKAIVLNIPSKMHLSIMVIAILIAKQSLLMMLKGIIKVKSRM